MKEKTHIQKKTLSKWDVVKAILAVILLGYIVSQTNFSELVALRDRFSWEWFFITFLLFCALIAAKAVQYYYLIEKRLPFSRVLEIIVVQKALMNFVATAAGIASYLTMLSTEKDIRFGRAAVSFVVAKVGDLIAVLFFLILSLLMIDPLPKAANRIVVIAFIFIVMVVISFLATILLRRKFVRFVEKILRFMRLENISFSRKVLGMLKAMADQEPKKIVRFLLTAILLSTIYMSFLMLWGYARLRLFSFVVNIEVVIFVHVTLQIASWIPIQILGGLGVSETLLVYLFSLFGEDRLELVTVIIGVRLIFYLMNAFSLLYLPIETMLRANAQETE
ncbi:MAG: flippase-like domain-containing protein [Anaerolineales bacterium]|nr:flippase-like domain-containing protein [Anaerolineales bacterium]